jgi:hypothetical protein
MFGIYNKIDMGCCASTEGIYKPNINILSPNIDETGSPKIPLEQ